MKRICIITAGHLSTCPRMMKVADTAADAGYQIRMVCGSYLDWAAAQDLTAMKQRSWKRDFVEYRRRHAPVTYAKTALRLRMADKWVRLRGPSNVSLNTAAAAQSRIAKELLTLALQEPADLFYGGTTGGIAIAALAARQRSVPYGIDLEDFYEGEFDAAPETHFPRDLVRQIQQDILPGASFVTAGSRAIAWEYERLYRVAVTPIHNTFPLPHATPKFDTFDGKRLKMYWFSQTIGPHRGLEEIVRAINLARVPVELHLRGHAAADYLETLERLSDNAGAPSIQVHPPAPPDQMPELCRPYDVGLALETGHVRNRALCLSNKACTYLLAGLAVMGTETPGQQDLLTDLGGNAVSYRPGDIETLAAGLRKWFENPRLLVRARAASWEAACRRWHWEHDSDRGSLLRALGLATQPDSANPAPGLSPSGGIPAALQRN